MQYVVLLVPSLCMQCVVFPLPATFKIFVAVIFIITFSQFDFVQPWQGVCVCVCSCAHMYVCVDWPPTRQPQSEHFQE